MKSPPVCRSCGAPLDVVFADLGRQPLANSFITPERLAARGEPRFPLRARVCGACFLVQTDETPPPESIFTNYAYFSSYSASWTAHARRFAQVAIRRFGIGEASFVVEVASNDGYLLQHFLPCGAKALGVEPAANVAEAARARGVPTEVAFFNAETALSLAAREGRADLIVAVNVLAHVPNIRNFVAGFALLLKDDGAAVFEFPHLLNLIEQVQFDTIYHEHYFYLSLLAIEGIFASAGLRTFDIETLPTHGGSLRLYACKAEAPFPESPAVGATRERERRAGLQDLAGYRGFQNRAEAARASFLDFCARARSEGKIVAAYGAAAKGVTFLNFCGAGRDDIAMVADRNPEKQGKLTPGCHAPIVSPEALIAARPDYVVILPWNLAEEIRSEMRAIEEAGGRFVVAIPETRVL